MMWLLAGVALVFTDPRPPFTFLDRFSPSHLLILSLFLLSSVYVFTNYRATLAGYVHLVTVIVVFALHPYSSLFGKDGTPIVFGLYFLLLVVVTPALRSEHKLLAVTLLVSFVLIEAFVPRWLDRQSFKRLGLPEWADYVDGYNLHEGGYLRPSVDVDILGEFGPSRFVTNDYGFRYSKDIGYEKPRGAHRIIFVGDSFVAGYRTAQQDTIGAVLETGLRERLDKEVEVLIAGVHDTAWAARYLTKHAFMFDPDLVIVGITVGNDISGTYATATGRGFREGPIGDALLPDDAFDVSGLRGALLRLDRGLSSWDVYSHVRTAARDNPIGSWYGDYPGRVHVFDIYHALGHFYTRGKVDIVEESFAMLERTLLTMKQAAGEKGVDILFVVFPQRFQVQASEWLRTVYAFGLEETSFDIEAPGRRILQGCERGGIQCLDVLPGLRRSENKSLFLPLGDMHMSKAGQELTGRLLRDFVLQKHFQVN